MEQVVNNKHIQGCLDDIRDATITHQEGTITAETLHAITLQRIDWIKKLVSAMSEDRTKWENRYWTLLQKRRNRA